MRIRSAENQMGPDANLSFAKSFFKKNLIGEEKQETNNKNA